MSDYQYFRFSLDWFSRSCDPSMSAILPAASFNCRIALDDLGGLAAAW